MPRSTALKSYHKVWLACHPSRTPEWLKERLADGFHVHHADGNHANDAPNNLILIEGLDHMLIVHGHKVAGIFTSDRGREMVARRWSKVSAAKRKKIMRKVARARWGRAKGARSAAVATV